MIFDEAFGRVVIISLGNEQGKARAARAIADLREKGLSEKAEVMRAVDGKVCLPSDWFKAGKGAWGCLMSHVRIVQDALMDGLDSVLIIEDDCVWQKSAAKLAAEFMGQVPDDWGQIYFGGQHRSERRPKFVPDCPAVIRAHRVHRTHCYALRRNAMVKFLQHVMYAPDYIEAAAKEGGRPMHIDHQLEVAHQRGDWPVYCPSFWLAGQGENVSHINGNRWPDKWWHIIFSAAHRKLPVIIADREPTLQEMRYIHFGNHTDPKAPTLDGGMVLAKTTADCLHLMEVIAQEAFKLQRLPGVANLEDRPKWLEEKWSAGAIRLSTNPDLEALCDFPNNGFVEHRWFNPPKAPVNVIETESQEETARMDEKRCVHQVWIGEKEKSPRLAAYCDSIRKAFPEWDYRLWTEEDMQGLAERAVMPGVVTDEAGVWPIGLRSDIVRLEILRQHGGVYMDCDFEALREDLRPLFADPAVFYYGDEQAGRPSNALMAAHQTHHPLVELYLRRIQANLSIPTDIWQTVQISGPERLAEALNLWVGSWKDGLPLTVTNERVGTVYGNGTVAGLWHETAYPYHYTKETYATFDPAKYPQAWVAHHWEGGWHK